MMRAFVFAGGRIAPAHIVERPAKEDILVAADSGWHNAKAMGVTPQVLLGDLDSIGQAEIPDKVELFRVPAEKDLTDTQLAVEKALSMGATEIVIIGGLSGRLDHTLSNLGILEHLHALKIHASMEDGYNRVRYLSNNSALVGRSDYKYLSLVAISPTVKGVEIDGVKYPLKNAKLTRQNQYAVSNEITSNCAFVSVKKGSIYMVESRDDT